MNREEGKAIVLSRALVHACACWGSFLLNGGVVVVQQKSSGKLKEF